MTTKQRREMMAYVEANAYGQNLRAKLTLAVSFGFALRDQEVESWQKLTAMQAAEELDKEPKDAA